MVAGMAMSTWWGVVIPGFIVVPDVAFEKGRTLWNGVHIEVQYLVENKGDFDCMFFYKLSQIFARDPDFLFLVCLLTDQQPPPVIAT